MPSSSRAEIESRAAAGEPLAQLELASLLDQSGDGEGARDWVERAAQSGDPLALGVMGEMLLSRSPLDAKRGLELTRSAAAGGNARAAHVASLLAANGVGQEQDWKTALGFLLLAAQGGWPLAQETIAATTSKQNLAASALRTRSRDPMLWQRMAQAIDLTPFFELPPVSVVSTAPRLAVMRGFLPPGVCDWLVARAKPMLSRAEVYDRESGGLTVDQNRTNTTAIFPLVGSDLILTLVRERMARATTRPMSFMELPSVLHYAPGEQYAPHHDFCDVSLPGPAKDVADHGQRVLTFLIYLNEDYEGGETDFPQLNWRFKGRKGDAVFWWSVDENGAPDPRTLHAGLPPTSGEKWLFSQWMRDKPHLHYR